MAASPDSPSTPPAPPAPGASAPLVQPTTTALKRWLLPSAVDRARVLELQRALQAAADQKGTGAVIDPELVALLVQRGITDLASARAFMGPRLEHLHDPRLLMGAEALVDRLHAAIQRGDTIGIHGDYDVDGISATALYATVLAKLGATVSPFVPHRFIDGYGVSVRAIRQWHAEGVRVILTCDTGFSAAKEVAEAVDDLGLEVLITDHHLPPDVLPKAHAMVNPNQTGCAYPNKHLCGAGVAFKTLQLLCQKMGLDERVVLFPHLDIVALPTICDVMRIEGENRVLVKYGLKVLRDTQNLGLQAVLRKAKVTPDKVNEETCGFVIGPRLNAAGRLDDAAKGLDLLLATTPEAAEALASELEDLNTQRKATAKAIEDSALEMIAQMDLDDVYGLCLFGPDPTDPANQGPTPPTLWHHGVIGIVASRIVERFGRPTFLFAYDAHSQQWKGSGRAPAMVGSVHLKHAMETVKAQHPALVVKAGGHAAAAGATLDVPTQAARDTFAAAFNDACRPMLTADERVPTLRADLEVTLDRVTPAFFSMLQTFAPFGQGNEKVRLIARGVTVTAAKAVGADKTHLKLETTQNGTKFDGIAFSMARLIPETVSQPLPYTADLCFELGLNTFRNLTTIQLEVKDVAMPLTRSLGASGPSGLAPVVAAPPSTPDDAAEPPAVAAPRPRPRVTARRRVVEPVAPAAPAGVAPVALFADAAALPGAPVVRPEARSVTVHTTVPAAVAAAGGLTGGAAAPPAAAGRLAHLFDVANAAGAAASAGGTEATRRLSARSATPRSLPVDASTSTPGSGGSLVAAALGAEVPAETTTSPRAPRSLFG